MGGSCSGKTTLAARLAERLGVPHIELDALHHGPNWQEATAEELRARVESALAGQEGWVADGNYMRKLGTWLVDQADTIVLLDLPLWCACAGCGTGRRAGSVTAPSSGTPATARPGRTSS